MHSSSCGWLAAVEPIPARSPRGESQLSVPRPGLLLLYVTVWLECARPARFPQTGCEDSSLSPLPHPVSQWLAITRDISFLPVLNPPWSLRQSLVRLLRATLPGAPGTRKPPGLLQGALCRSVPLTGRERTGPRGPKRKGSGQNVRSVRSALWASRWLTSGCFLSRAQEMTVLNPVAVSATWPVDSAEANVPLCERCGATTLCTRPWLSGPQPC